jgi:hypothetical protein
MAIYVPNSSGPTFHFDGFAEKDIEHFFQFSNAQVSMNIYFGVYCLITEKSESLVTLKKCFDKQKHFPNGLAFQLQICSSKAQLPSL